MKYLLIALATAWLASCSSTKDQPQSILATGKNEAGSGGTSGAGGSNAVGGNGGKDSTSTTSISVVSGNFLGEEVLYALDGDSGYPLSNEYLTAVALGYDGYRDHWYIFEGSNVPVTAEQRGRLHIRRFDLEALSWEPINTVENILLPRNPRDFVMLDKALAYLSDREAAPGSHLVVLNTTNPESVQLLIPESFDVSPSIADRTVIGLMGSSPSLQTTRFINILERQDLGGDSCALYVHHHTLSNNQISANPTPELMVANYACANSPSWIGDPSTGGQLVIMPPATGQQLGTILRFHAESLIIQAQHPFTLPIHRDTRSFGPLSLAPCGQIALVAEVGSEQALHAIPISHDAFSAVASAGLGYRATTISYARTGQRTLLGYADDDQFGLSAYELAGTCIAPQLTPLSMPPWTPPVSLAPRIVARPQTLPLACPDPCDI